MFGGTAAAIELQGMFESFVADDGTEHPEDGCGFVAEVELVGGMDEGLTFK